jgi:energy-converting hydrogenase Eha subunit G
VVGLIYIPINQQFIVAPFPHTFSLAFVVVYFLDDSQEWQVFLVMAGMDIFIKEDQKLEAVMIYLFNSSDTF